MTFNWQHKGKIKMPAIGRGEPRSLMTKRRQWVAGRRGVRQNTAGAGGISKKFQILTLFAARSWARKTWKYSTVTKLYLERHKYPRLNSSFFNRPAAEERRAESLFNVASRTIFHFSATLCMWNNWISHPNLQRSEREQQDSTRCRETQELLTYCNPWV